MPLHYVMVLRVNLLLDADRFKLIQCPKCKQILLGQLGPVLEISGASFHNIEDHIKICQTRTRNRKKG
jgi:hypothetical protein